MEIVHDVLEACGYNIKETFSFTYRWNDTQCSRQVCPFVSGQYPDDVYLLVALQPEELAHTLDNSFMSSLATSFRKQPFHRSAMDRNTTLVLSCLHNAGDQTVRDMRVQLEDDPYYFKKYVFAYTSEEKAAAERYIAEKCRDGGTLLETIRECLLDTELFAAYKRNDPERRVYGYFVELATKVTVLPIRPNSEYTIKTVESIWREELQKIPEINLDALEVVLELDADKTEEMLDRWCDLTRVISI